MVSRKEVDWQIAVLQPFQAKFPPSQNWSSDGHFEVLNSSIYQLVKKLWQKWKTRKNAKNAKITKNSTYEIFFLQNRTKTKMEKIAFCVITFHPIKIKTHSAPQNDRLNFSFVKDIHVDGGNLAWNSFKTAICQCTFFLLTLYLYKIHIIVRIKQA